MPRIICNVVLNALKCFTGYLQTNGFPSRFPVFVLYDTFACKTFHGVQQVPCTTGSLGSEFDLTSRVQIFYSPWKKGYVSVPLRGPIKRFIVLVQILTSPLVARFFIVSVCVSVCLFGQKKKFLKFCLNFAQR